MSKIPNRVGRMPLRATRGSRIAYNFFDVFFSTIMFVLGYYLWIRFMEDRFQMLLYIFIWSLVSGLVGSLTSRILVRYWQTEKNIQHVLASLLSSMMYALVMWLGFIIFMMDQYDLTTAQGILSFVMMVLFIKLLVFLGADYLADRITFQSG